MINRLARYVCPVYFLISLALLSGTASAQDSDTSPVEAGDYLIHFSTFNSSFLTPEVASVYGFVRGSDRALINVAVTKAQPEEDSYGLPAQVSGVARNLMQQQTPLEFVEIREQNAIYFIAPFQFDDEEVLNFEIGVVLPGNTRTTPVRFSKKFYED